MPDARPSSSSSRPIDGSHHALVAYVDGDPQPSRSRASSATDRDSAEIAFAVADELPAPRHRLGARGRADRRRARGRHHARSPRSRASDNPAALALIRRTANVLDVRLEGPELSIRAAIA